MARSSTARKKVIFILTSKIDARLSAEAQRTGESRSCLVRRALDVFLPEQEYDGTSALTICKEGCTDA